MEEDTEELKFKNLGISSTRRLTWLQKVNSWYNNTWFGRTKAGIIIKDFCLKTENLLHLALVAIGAVASHKMAVVDAVGETIGLTSAIVGSTCAIDAIKIYKSKKYLESKKHSVRGKYFLLVTIGNGLFAVYSIIAYAASAYTTGGELTNYAIVSLYSVSLGVPLLNKVLTFGFSRLNKDVELKLKATDEKKRLERQEERIQGELDTLEFEYTPDEEVTEDQKIIIVRTKEESLRQIQFLQAQVKKMTKQNKQLLDENERLKLENEKLKKTSQQQRNKTIKSTSGSPKKPSM